MGGGRQISLLIPSNVLSYEFLFTKNIYLITNLEAKDVAMISSVLFFTLTNLSFAVNKFDNVDFRLDWEVKHCVI